jgi:dTDP-4-dehydrorhamnose reductase
VSSPRVLITGGGGQLASDLEALLEARLEGSAEVHAPPRAVLDVTEDSAVASAFAELRPTLVVNCAAFHNVEVCERKEDRAFEVNVRAVKRLAVRCAEAGSQLVHLSTNYVFDGAAAEPYDESDSPNPRSIYAISKLAGEYAALGYAPDALVVRTAGLYGLHGSASKGGNFVTRMIARAREQGALSVVADQLLTPTFTDDLASGILAAVEAGVTGTVHLTNSGATSWHGFTEAIMDLAGVDVPVAAGTTSIAVGAADRPLNGILRSSVAERAGLAPLRPWRDALLDYLERAGLLAGVATSSMAGNGECDEASGDSTRRADLDSTAGHRRRAGVLL